MAVELNAVCFSNFRAPRLVILHGLLGSARNWMSAGKALSQFCDVAVLDLRNHGKSPHVETMEVEEMIEDVVHWIKQNAKEPVYLLGHSLGGKIAMALACRHPELLKGLIIEDIVPKDYGIRHDQDFTAMNELNLGEARTRADIDTNSISSEYFL